MNDPRNFTGTEMRMTQHERILDYMDKHGSISQLEGAIHLHITKINTRISELRRKGYNIPDTWETSEGSKYKRYFSPKYQQRDMF
jgi:hypothetical protein